MKLFLRILKWIALCVVIIFTAGFLYLYFFYFALPEQIVKVDAVRDDAWHTIALKGNTMCSDGSEFLIFFRKGTSKNLLIYFSGGGACWDGNSCGQPISLMSAFDGDSRELKSFYIPSLMRFFPEAIGGIAENENEVNAFRDWNFVFIPYCTGDFGIGNATNSYTLEGKTLVVHHNGRNNTLSTLDWIFANFKQADKILVAGESAGGYTSAFWAPYIADHYTGKQIYELSDGALLSSSRWKEIIDTVWQTESANVLHFQIDKDVFEDALIHRTDSVKRQIKYLHSNTMYDEVLPRFSAVLNHSPVNSNRFIDDWSRDLRRSMRQLRDADIDYNYFLTDFDYHPALHTTPHTITTNNYYYECKSEGVSFVAWLKRNVIDDESFSLGEDLLSK